MANKAFGKKLRELRVFHGYTQQQVADLLKLKNKSTLGNWEIGNSEPDAMTFLQLCKIYKVDDILLEFTGEPLKEQSNKLNDTSNITEHEKEILRSYRQHSEHKKTIDKILDIKDTDKSDAEFGQDMFKGLTDKVKRDIKRGTLHTK